MKKTSLLVALIFLSCFAYAQKSNFEGTKKINGAGLYFNVRGTGEYLLVIHGGPGLNHAYFIPHLNQLEKKFTIIYYDQRACGKSSIPTSDSISIKFLVNDIESIRKEFKTEKINILAHSWGAVLATHYALAYPEKINKLVMSNSGMFSHEYDQEVLALMQKKSTKEDSLARAKILSKGNLDARDYEKIFLSTFELSAYDKANVKKIDLKLPDNFAIASNALFTGLSKDPAMNANLYDSLSALKIPVLIINGQSDLVPPNALRRLREKLPQAKLEVFKKSGHFPFVEETGLYNDRVIAFLK